MKRISILILIALMSSMIGNVATAKTKQRKAKTTSSAVTLARAIAYTYSNPKKFSQLTELYYKKVPTSKANNMEESIHYIYGKNAKVTSVRKDNVIVKATGPNAFYYEHNSFNNYQEEYGAASWTFNFSSKTDRDTFWNEYKNEPFAEKGYKNGWYWVSSWGD